MNRLATEREDKSLGRLPVGGAPSAASASRAPALLMGVGIAAFTLGMLYATRRLGFWQDEWSFVTTRLNWNPGVFLRAFNQQPMIFPVLVYKLLLVSAGLEHAWPYRLALLLMHGLCVVLLWLVARKRLGDWLALVPAGLLLGLGAAWEDLTLALQINYLGSVAAGLAALLFLERADRRDRIACALLVIAWMWSSVGVSIILGVGCGLVWTRSWRRLWIVIVPLALYGVWYAAYGSSTAELTNLSMFPEYFWAAGGAVFGGIVGAGATLGKVLFAGCALWLVRRFLRREEMPVDAVIGIGGYLAFWLITDLNRAQYHQPNASRYIYPAAVLVLVAASALVRYRPAHRLAWAAIAAIMVVILSSGYKQLRSAVNNRNEVDTEVKAELGALELAGPTVPGAILPDAHHAPVLTVAGYRNAERRLHSHAGFTAAQILAAPEEDRELVDMKLASWEGVRARPAVTAPITKGPPLVIEGSVRGTASHVGSCVVFRPAAVRAHFQLRVDRGRAVVLQALRAPAHVGLIVRRFASDFAPPSTKIALDRVPEFIGFPTDGSPLAWHMRLGTSAPVRVCSMAG